MEKPAEIQPIYEPEDLILADHVSQMLEEANSAHPLMILISNKPGR
jgi:hypothetical protein